MPTNLYGPNDNYDLDKSHVLPALIRKAHEAKARGDATLVVGARASRCVNFSMSMTWRMPASFLMEKGVGDGLINIGAGSDLTIRELAADRHGGRRLQGHDQFRCDQSPDGTPRKLMDSGKLNALGWHAKIAPARGNRQRLPGFSRQTCGARARLIPSLLNKQASPQGRWPVCTISSTTEIPDIL